MTRQSFPLLWDYGEREIEKRGPAAVPWDLVAPHEAQAMRNHGGQTLARLADRGGLSVVELYYVLRDEPFAFGAHVSRAKAIAYVQSALVAAGG